MAQQSPIGDGSLATDMRWTSTEATVAADDSFFILIGAILVLGMHAGFAFVELGSVSKKNESNALMKILVDVGVTAVVYLLAGYTIAYDVALFTYSATALSLDNGVLLMRYFFLMTFAGAVPGIVSGGIAERATFTGHVIGTIAIVGGVYPVFEAVIWGKRWGLQTWLASAFGYQFHDFAGSVVVHALGGWIALSAMLLLGPRIGRTPLRPNEKLAPMPVSSMPMVALGTWALVVGWFGFNVMSAQSLAAVSGLVAVNTLLALAGGILSSLAFSKLDAASTHNGALAGLVAICSGSDVMHPLLALVTGAVAGFIYVKCCPTSNISWKIDDPISVWPIHGLCGVWGGLATGLFGLETFSGVGGVAFLSQLIGSALCVAFGLLSGFLVYGIIVLTVGFRLSKDDEVKGTDIVYNHIPFLSLPVLREEAFAAQTP